MKQIIYLLTFLIFFGCKHSKTETTSVSDILTLSDTDTITKDNNINVQQKSTVVNQSDEAYLSQYLSGFEKATLFNLRDKITADFDGDGNIDKVLYKKESGTSGIIFIHGKTNEQIRIGFGKPIAHLTEFDWVDYWGLVEDRVTSETTFTKDGDVLGSKVVNLQNPSIALGKEEVGGGLLTFLNGKYVWIHQTD
ncbi:hypothetical protein [Cognataquiflexum nitidum]|uniref:hypothetical protein n=1 Tax=Cognataquiflexum nitidum TaxID=2922272 RepID=UPI001F130782|nr:hypothetical protein [Cognataquiflexum nitidum]